MHRHAFDTIVLDFDYTLVDSSQGVIECIRYALDRLGLPPVSDQKACRTIGLSLLDTLTALTGLDDRALGQAFSDLFVARAEQVMNERTVLLAGVPETIAQLKQRGLNLGIVSNKYRRRIEEFLRQADLCDAFAIVVGEEDVSAHKPDPQGLCKTIAALGAVPENTVYVGDSTTDAQTARRAGVPFVAVLTGVTPREAFVGHQAYRIIDRLSELCDLV
jgi:phosphoglycolate phosphatase